MDIVGKTFNKLKVLEYKGKNKHDKKMFECYCLECENTKLLIGTEVKNGYKKDCGCQNSKRISEGRKNHGMSSTRIYHKWKDIKSRCYRKNSQNYKFYGGRGIKVCEKWKNDFLAFYKDVGDIPFEGAELDRIDNDGDYEPNNCRWVDHKQNSNNRRAYKNKTGYTGVTFKPKLNKYQAQLYHNKKFIYLGIYNTAEEAYNVYLSEKEKLK